MARQAPPVRRESPALLGQPEPQAHRGPPALPGLPEPQAHTVPPALPGPPEPQARRAAESQARVESPGRGKSEWQGRQEPRERGESEWQSRSNSEASGSFKLGIAVVIISILAAIMAIFFKGRLPSLVLYSIFAICVLGLIVGILAGLRAFRSSYRSVERARESSDAWPDTKDNMDDIPDYAWGDPETGKENTENDRLQKSLQQEARISRSLEENARKIRRLSEQKAELASAAAQQNREYEELRRQLEKQNWEQEKRNELNNRLEDYREALESARAAQKQINQELDCVQTAQDIIEALSSEIHDNFGTQLNASVEKTMQEITGSSRRFSLSRDFKISVDNSRDYVDMDRLSKGTTDQLYLSLRLNAAQLLFGRRSMPLILDDTFAYYDDDRLKALLQWLMDHYTGQILLLTCHHREENILEALNFDYNYVNLDSTQM